MMMVVVVVVVSKKKAVATPFFVRRTRARALKYAAQDTHTTVKPRHYAHTQTHKHGVLRTRENVVESAPLTVGPNARVREQHKHCNAEIA